jgi:hypothetical protein
MPGFGGPDLKTVERYRSNERHQGQSEDQESNRADGWEAGGRRRLRIVIAPFLIMAMRVPTYRIVAIAFVVIAM